MLGENADDDDDDADLDVDIKEMHAKSLAGFDANDVARLRQWLPKAADATLPPAAAAGAAALLNRTLPEHIDAVNLPSMYIFRIISEASWIVYQSPTKAGVVLAFSSPDKVAEFALKLPAHEFDTLKGYEMGAAFIDDADSVQAVAFDPRSLDDLKPSVTPDKMMVFLHWADSIYFERFLAQLNPDLPTGKVDEEEFDARAIWERTYIVGAVGVERAKGPTDIALLTDSADRVVVAISPDHVAEFVAHGDITPITLTGEELLDMLKQQKTGVSFTVGADVSDDDKPSAGPNHRSIVWTFEQAVRILEMSRASAVTQLEDEAKAEQPNKPKTNKGLPQA
jgi:hypothetical protein